MLWGKSVIFRGGMLNLTRGTPSVHNKQAWLVLRHLNGSPSVRTNPITVQQWACNTKGTHSFSSCSLSASRVLDLGSEATTGIRFSKITPDQANGSLKVSPSNKLDSI